MRAGVVPAVFPEPHIALAPGTAVPPYPVSLSMVSDTRGQPRSENVKWKIPEINNLWDFPRGPVAKTGFSMHGAQGSIPGQGTRSHMPQVRVCMLQL